ncbi:hypothetical protein MTR55_23235 [Escherichia coli]|nr:hypothetical protein [Escherichia coli]
MDEKRIERLEQLLQAHQQEYGSKWGRAAMPHEYPIYFQLEDLIKNNGKKFRPKNSTSECHEVNRPGNPGD